MDRRTLLLAIAIGVVSGLASALWSRVSAPQVAVQPQSVAARGEAAPPALGEVSGARSVAGRSPVEVKVIRNSAGVGNAEVLLWRRQNGRWTEAGGARTDDDGVAGFVTLRGAHLVLAKVDGEQATRVVDVAAATESQRFEIDLGSHRTVSGRVIDSKTRQPIPGAQVRFMAAPDGATVEPVPEAAGTASADSLGRFSLTVGPDAVQLEVRAARYSRLLETFGEKSGEKASALTLELEPAGAIEGVVVTATGAAVSGATVRAEPSDGFTALSDEVGRFLLQVPAGHVTLDAASPAGRHALLRLEAKGGDVTRGARLVIDEGTAVEGRVVDAESKAPIGGATVQLLSEPDAVLLGQTLATADGAFQFAAIPKGQYSVRARLGAGSRGQRVGVEVPTSSVEVPLWPASALTGRVVDGEGRPVAGADVEVLWPGAIEEAQQTAKSGDDGTFGLDGLLPAEVTVVAKFGEGVSREASVYLAPGASASVTLTLEGQGTLVGTVTGPGGPYDLMVFGEEARRVGTRLQTEKDFTVKLPPGRYSVIASIHGKGVSLNPRQRAEVKAGVTTRVDVDAQVFDGGMSIYGIASHPASGVSFDNVAGNVEVSWLATDSPAYEAGLRVGDVVVSIDGEPVKDSLAAFARARGARGEGGPVSYLVRRDGADRLLTVR